MDIRNDCLVRVSNLLSVLPDSEKKIAQLVLECPQEVMRLPTKSIAARAAVAPSSIIRFCQRVGYKGVSEFKLALAQAVAPVTDVTISDVTAFDSSTDIVTKIFNTSKKALDDTLSLLDFRAIDRAADMILSAKRIEFYGVGTSAQIASDAYYRLMRVGFPVYCATDPHIMRISASLLGKDCLAVAISHTGRTIDTMNALQIAKEAGARTLCITSYLRSPITQIADVSLVTTTAETQYLREAVASRIAQIALLDALYTLVSMQRSNKVTKRIQRMNEILHEVRIK